MVPITELERALFFQKIGEISKMPTAIVRTVAVPSGQDTVATKIKSIFEKPLSKAFFPEGTVTEKDVRSAFGSITLNMTDSELRELVQQVSDVKTDVISWGKQHVKELMAKNSKEFLHDITNFEGLCNYWKANGDGDTAAILWQTCYGSFDLMINWELELEEEYMAFRGYSYEVSDKKSKGCIARSLVLRKSEAIKRLNMRAHLTHGGKIKLARENVAASNGKKFAKRPKGTTMGPYATIDGVEFYEVHKVIERLRKGKYVSSLLCVMEVAVPFAHLFPSASLPLKKGKNRFQRTNLQEPGA